eukprot:8081820-Alexandrium_andersonii.AAC.1
MPLCWNNGDFRCSAASALGDANPWLRARGSPPLVLLVLRRTCPDVVLAVAVVATAAAVDVVAVVAIALARFS